MKKQEVRDWINRGIYGMIPIYHKDGGNFTKLIFHHNPSMIVEKKICTVIKRFAEFFQKDISLTKQLAKDITGQRNMNPLPISPNIILVPFRMRKPIGKDDGAMGYIFNSFIEDTEETMGEVRITLRDGKSIKIEESLSTARHRLACAHQIYYHLVRHDTGSEFSPNLGLVPISTFNVSFDQPATKRDLAIISENIERLTNYLKKI